jgi:type VI secretion system ImpC/EvpB family protein/type VI secretion system ImpB/VipA family protein
MPNTISFGKFEFNLSPTNTARPRDPEEPFRLLILADLGGRQSRGQNLPIQGRRPVHVDIDNFQKEFAGLQPAVRIQGGPGGSLDFSFSSLDDFHPDAILKRSPWSEWLETRKRLLDASTAQAALDDVNRLLGRQVPAGMPGSGAATAGGSVPEATADTLARLMGDSGATPRPPAAPASSRAAASVDAFIRSIISPANVPTRTSEQSVYLQALEEELSRRLRALLHDQNFQALEANWRGVDRLVRDFGGEETIKIFLFDLSRGELETDLCSQSDLGATGLFRGLRDVSWGAVVAAFSFSDTLVDFEILGRLAKIGEALRAPVFAAAHERLVGCSSLATTPDPDDWRSPMGTDMGEVWNALRRRTEMQQLGLALPRVLLRLPYGKGHDEVDAFPFEELEATRPHETFLWGNAAFACGHVILQAFQAEGWDLSMSGAGEVGDLPVYRFLEDGSTRVKPCAEAWLSDRAAERMDDAGFIAIQSIKNRDAVRVANLRSLSSTGTTFANG